MKKDYYLRITKSDHTLSVKRPSSGPGVVVIRVRADIPDAWFNPPSLPEIQTAVTLPPPPEPPTPVVTIAPIDLMEESQKP